MKNVIEIIILSGKFQGENILLEITDPPPHTHTIVSKEMKTSTLECKENSQIWKIPHHKNVNNSKNHCSPVKLESKKNYKKVLASRDGSGGAIQSIVQKKLRPVQYLKELLVLLPKNTRLLILYLRILPKEFLEKFSPIINY